MAKRRKTAARRSAKRGKARKFSSNDNMIALVVLVLIVLGLAGLYYYQQKAKKAQLDFIPAIVSVEARAIALT